MELVSGLFCFFFINKVIDSRGCEIGVGVMVRCGNIVVCSFIILFVGWLWCLDVFYEGIFLFFIFNFDVFFIL